MPYDLARDPGFAFDCPGMIICVTVAKFKLDIDVQKAGYAYFGKVSSQVFSRNQHGTTKACVASRKPCVASCNSSLRMECKLTVGYVCKRRNTLSACMQACVSEA